MHLPHSDHTPSGPSAGLERPRLRPLHAAVLLVLAAFAALQVTGASAAPASAAPAAGPSNWAGYVSTGRATHFTDASATWVVPAVSCTSGRPTYMSSWVGLGGERSQSVEQIGTEADCDAGGTATYSSWFELYPTRSGAPNLAIRPGDVVSAAVTVTGRDVRLSMTNRTLGARFSRRLRADRLDVGSAEWIVEAPSVCPTAHACSDAVLSDFGSTRFTRARASAGGRQGTVTGPGWTTTAYTLTGGPRAGSGRAMTTAHRVSPTVLGALSANHESFGVTFAGR